MEKNTQRIELGAQATPIEITYLVGDATKPISDEPTIIAHVCNDEGGWGAGFVLAVSKRWPEPEASYRKWHAEREDNDFRLGSMQLVPVEERLWVANMIGQHGVKPIDGVPPIRYAALEMALRKLRDRALQLGAEVHMPRIGCGLAGGQWADIEPLVNLSLASRGIRVFVYDLP